MDGFIPLCWGALTAGIITSVTYCSAMCAPLLTTWIMGRAGSGREGVKSFAWFSLGRLITYPILGASAGYLGHFIDNAALRHYAPYLSGAILIAMGILMLLRPKNQASCQGRHKTIHILAHSAANAKRTPMVIAGCLVALSPCPPMLGLLSCSVPQTELWQSAVLMTLFGVGTFISPLLLMCCGAGLISRALHRAAPQHPLLFRRYGGILLLTLGVFSILLS